MLKLTLSVLTLFSIAACSPKFDWRDARDGVSPYTVLMPGKPSAMTRDIQLGEQTVPMRMTATEVDNIKFAVGAAEMSSAAVAVTTLGVIKRGLLKNMAGNVTDDKSSSANVNGIVTEAFTVSGTASMRMQAHLVARGNWVFQVLVVGPENKMNQEATETFFTSFKPD